MNFILLILIIIAVIITLLFVETLKVKFIFDTTHSDMNMTLFWLYPLIKILVTVEDTRPVMSLYLFNKYLFRKEIKKKKRNTSTTKLIKIINPKNVRINADYGFIDPFNTGITCGVMEIASQFINIDAINYKPDFMTISDYIYLDATANINLGTALVNFLKQKTKRRNLLWIRHQA